MTAARRRLGGSLATACLVGALLGAPSAAVGAVSFEVIPGQSTIGIPSASQVAYTLKMTTDAEQEERFSVWLEPSSFNGLDPGPGNPLEGATLQQVGNPTLGGAGIVDFLHAFPSSVPACSGRGPGYHGIFGGGGGLAFVTLPPSSETTLLYRLNVASHAPWPSTRYTPTFTASPNMLPGSTIPAMLSVPSPEPAVIGISGVEIRFRTKPRSFNLADVSRFAPPVREGKKVTILGSTDPKLRRQKLRLIVFRSGDKKPKLLAKVRTGRNGKFRYSGWEPKKGDHELWVRYRSQRQELASDFTCSRLLEVTKGKKG